MLYYLAASALGAGWLLVLLIPKTTGQWIRVGPQWSVAPLILGSILTAYLFKTWISSARTTREQAKRAFVIPYAGCLIYLTLLNIFIEAQNLRIGAHISTNDSVARYVWGSISAIYGFYVVIPYGFVCQVVLNRICRNEEQRNAGTA
jgi:hypothetical protein